MKFNLVLPCVATLALLSACSPGQNVSLKGVDLSTSQIGSETYVNMEAIIAMGNLKFPNVEVPVINPTNMQVFGQMALQSLADGTNRMYVSIDYEAATKLNPSLGKTLPNQRELPLQLGIDANTTIVGIPVLEQSRIYVGGDLQKNLYIGAAIAVPAFDSVMTQVPFPLNIFFGFPFSPEVSGYAGLFTGTQKGQNGIGIFIKKIPPPPTAKMMSRTLASIKSTSDTSSITPTGGEEINQLNTYTLIKLDRLLKRKATLKVK